MSKKSCVKLHYLVKTDIGSKRTVNQDSVAAFVTEEAALFVVADGMGGYSQGEVASGEVVSACREYWDKNKDFLSEKPFLDCLQDLETMLRKVNIKIHEEYNQSQICGSTVVLLFVVQDCYAVLSVGDSHAYSYANGCFSTLTVDDVWENLSSTRQRFSAEEIEEHRNKGKLVQAIGTTEEINPYVHTGRMKGNQTFLLCSDGLYKYCSEDYLEKQLKKVKSEKSMNTVMQRYMDCVYKNGAKDNISIILVRGKKNAFFR